MRSALADTPTTALGVACPSGASAPLRRMFDFLAEVVNDPGVTTQVEGSDVTVHSTDCSIDSIRNRTGVSSTGTVGNWTKAWRSNRWVTTNGAWWTFHLGDLGPPDNVRPMRPVSSPEVSPHAPAALPTDGGGGAAEGVVALASLFVAAVESGSGDAPALGALLSRVVRANSSRDSRSDGDVNREAQEEAFLAASVGERYEERDQSRRETIDRAKRNPKFVRETRETASMGAEVFMAVTEPLHNLIAERGLVPLNNLSELLGLLDQDDTDRLAGWVGSMCERITSQHGKPIKSPFGLLHHQLSEPGDWSPTPTGSETKSVLWRMPNGSLHDPVFFIDDVNAEELSRSNDHRPSRHTQQRRC